MKKLTGSLAWILILSLLLSACAAPAATDAAEDPAPPRTEETSVPETPAPAEAQEKTDAELAALYSSPENLYLLDLSLPLLEEGYVDADAAAAARSSALSLRRYVWDTEGPEALAALGDLDGDSQELVRLKNAWLDAIGATEDYTPFAPLPF